MVMSPATTQHQGIPASAYRFVVLVDQAPRYQSLSSHFESVQKATITGAI
jgi:hypothetical protein